MDDHQYDVIDDPQREVPIAAWLRSDDDVSFQATRNAEQHICVCASIEYQRDIPIIYTTKVKREAVFSKFHFFSTCQEEEMFLLLLRNGLEFILLPEFCWNDTRRNLNIVFIRKI